MLFSCPMTITEDVLAALGVTLSRSLYICAINDAEDPKEYPYLQSNEVAVIAGSMLEAYEIAKQDLATEECPWRQMTVYRLAPALADYPDPRVLNWHAEPSQEFINPDYDE